MNDAEMMKHFGVFLLGNIEQEPWIRLSMSTVRDMVTQAWTEGYRAGRFDEGDQFEPDYIRDQGNPYEWSKK